MRNFIHGIYSSIEDIRTAFFGIRSPLHRPLFLYRKDIRFFLKKYGTNSNHYKFKSLDSAKQLEFLNDYQTLLKIAKPNIVEMRVDYLTRTLHIKKTSSDLTVFFSDTGTLLYTSKSKSGCSGYGCLGISFEINL